MLSQSTHFKKHGGKDHVVLWSLHEHHFWPRGGCDVFMKEFCALCTFTCYWMNYSKPENRFVSVPFPSAYHWFEGIEKPPWDLAHVPQRNLTAVYLGSTLTITPYHTKIRRAVTGQCKVGKGCHWLRIFHSSTDNNIAVFLSSYQRAVFCLCPPGDDPGRKAVFDSLVAGCIPVIFDVSSVYNQYPWHLGERDALEVSVFVPGTRLIRGGADGLDVMTVLQAIPPGVIRRKQEAIARIAPRLQYSIPPLPLLMNRSDDTRWDPPFPDAADMVLDGLFERVAHVLNGEPTGLPRLPLLGTGAGTGAATGAAESAVALAAGVTGATGNPEDWIKNYGDVRVVVPR